MTIWIDGRYMTAESASVSVLDHGLLYGDGVFEGIRVYGGRAFRLEEHISRLYESARAIELGIPMEEAGLIRAVEDAISKDGREESYMRLLVTRGKGTLGLDPASCPRPSVILIVDQVSVYPAEIYERGLDLVTVGTRRTPRECLDPRIKSLNYLNNVLARAEAVRAGAHEALMLNMRGFVAECTADNIFMVKDGALFTPDPADGALNGITMQAVIELARKRELDAGYAELTQEDLYGADECFLTGTAVGIVPVARVDRNPIGKKAPGPVTREIMEAYAGLVRSEHVRI